MAKSPADIAAKWANRTAQATTEYKQGVEGVSVAPGEAAAAAVHRMVAELQRQLDSGELEAAMRSVSLSEWKQATLQKGAERLASGARTAQPKMQKFMSQFLPYAENVSKSLPPRGDFSQNMQRMIENAEKLHQFKHQK